MSNGRMFNREIVQTKRFLEMPASSQALFFHLGLNADDDGIVQAWKVMNLTRASEDDLKILVSKGFVIPLCPEDYVFLISDWRRHNTIRADRYKPGLYHDLLVQMYPEALVSPK